MPPMKRDSYAAVLDELLALTENKRAGYSPGDDPFKNFRMSEMFSVDPVRGILVRVMDKMARVASLLDNPLNEKVGESLRDTMMDAGNYMLIAVAYMDDERAEVRAMVDRLAEDQVVLYEGINYNEPLDIKRHDFDSTDMEPPEDYPEGWTADMERQFQEDMADVGMGDLTLTTDSKGYITSIEGGPLEEPVSVAPDPCCEDDCSLCGDECKDECDNDCAGHEANVPTINDHDRANCPVCRVMEDAAR